MGILLLLSNAGWYIALITMRFQPVTQRIHDKCTYYCNYSTYPAFKTFVWMNGRILPLSICMPNKVYIPFRIHIICFMSIWDSSNTSTVYSHSLFSLYTPLQTTKTGFSVCFPNEKKKKSLIIPIGWILLAKDKETPCKETRCATADFPG